MTEEKNNSELNAANDKQKQGSDKKYNYLAFKIITFIFIVVAMGMCSIKFMS
jgi:hypothetical protein